MAAFIDEAMNILHIHQFVFDASIENVECPSVPDILKTVTLSPRQQIKNEYLFNTKIFNFFQKKLGITAGHYPGGTDPIGSAVAKRSNCQQSNADDRAVDTTIASTSNTADRHEEFVARDAISWRQGRFSWLEMVLVDYSARNQQTTL